MREPRPVAAAACGLAAALLLGACAPIGRQAADGGAVAPQANAQAAAQSTVDTPWGPLGPADRDLVVKVRQAGLWEIPVGREAERRAARAATRRNLGEIARQHVRLDALDRAVAAKLNVALPSRPTPDQQSWMSEITGKSGNDYDRTAVARLRMAHGQIYPAIAAVRGSTRNTLVRNFSEQCETFVRTHMRLLEGTGFVTGDMLPDPPQATGAPPPGDPGHSHAPAPAATSLLGGG
ncbi:DUF4142 domain-containing protein [Actinomadura sp. NPDC048955]|uniref:Putative membrane protein n=2 Tax=Actinomadura luteofluorescens TaxID=46163 RepID=A0A7Y9EAA0_9ACTN|nr:MULTISPECIES: DUF4142 domain-containing protein [Actinomadura]MCR3739179.1 putative membrane protein [Actinomadura glauciflava]NYD44070.1 putative membrane protein [Actinomadura luteofluorescens]